MSDVTPTVTPSNTWESWLKQSWINETRGCFYTCLNFSDQRFLRRFFENVKKNPIFPLIRVWHFNNLNNHHLGMPLFNMVHWCWRISQSFEKLIGRQTNVQTVAGQNWSKSFTWAFSSGELKRNKVKDDKKRRKR